MSGCELVALALVRYQFSVGRFYTAGTKSLLNRNEHYDRITAYKMEVYMVRFLCNTPTTRKHQLDRAHIFKPITLNGAK
jgi:hypothetical protein